MLHEQEVWLAANRDEIEGKIQAGYAAAKRGELLDAEEVGTRLDAFKRSIKPQQE